MALQQSTMVVNGNAVGGFIPDVSSALGYKETIGQACVNPNGYTAGSYFLGATDGYFYRVTANIAAGATITLNTNCVKTDVGSEFNALNTFKDLFSAEVTPAWNLNENMNFSGGYLKVGRIVVVNLFITTKQSIPAGNLSICSLPKPISHTLVDIMDADHANSAYSFAYLHRSQGIIYMGTSAAISTNNLGLSCTYIAQS